MQQGISLNISARKQCNKGFALILTRENNATKSFLEY